MNSARSTVLPCGCVLAAHEIGFRVNVHRCDHHRASGGKTGFEHYSELGCFKDGIPQTAHYQAELNDMLARLDFFFCPSDTGTKLFEIGYGAGMYIPMLIQRGYDYTGIDADDWAARYCQSLYGFKALHCKIEESDDWSLPFGKQDVVLACHVLEHCDDAMKALSIIRKTLRPGGWFVGVIPNDDDLANPDHVSFFSQSTFTAALTAAGFTDDIRVRTEKIVEREHFIYFAAR